MFALQCDYSIFETLALKTPGVDIDKSLPPLFCSSPVENLIDVF